MFGTKEMQARAREEQSALKARLVDLYTKLQGGALTDEQRAKLQRAIDEVEARMNRQTRKLAGGESPEVPAL
ncbi:MAG: hypothetical protein ACRDZ4_00350 [Egibacteraceae bacterium]